VQQGPKEVTQNNNERMNTMLQDKKIIIIGDRDGIPAPAIEECIKTTGAEIVFASTECFV
jgi:betaine reductase